MTRSAVRCCVVGWGLATALGGIACGQEKAAVPVAATAAQADAADALGPAFEVATVRPGKQDAGRGGWMGVRLAPSGRLMVQSMSLAGLVSYAYGGRVAGGPGWAESDRYDITAKVDDAQMVDWDRLSESERRARVQPMLRTLLAERFRLKVHPEMRMTPVYTVVQAKGGAKLKQVSPPAALEGDGDSIERAMRLMNEHPGQRAPGMITCTGDGCSGTAVEMKGIVAQSGASAGLDAMTVDQTGLKGYFDFSYTVSREKDAEPAVEQIEDQLGLRFESRKMPLKTYVIDAAEKPSEN